MPANRKDADKFLRALEAATNKVADEFGYSHAKISAARFTASMFRAKFEFDTPDESGDIITPEARAWKRYAGIHGLPTNAVEDELQFRLPSGKTVIPMGFRSRATKRPILYREVGGKQYVCETGMLRLWTLVV